MESTDKRKLDAIAARAVHDLEMREILSDVGLFQSDPRELRAALDQLSASQKFDLYDRSMDLEEASGLSNDAYKTLGDYAQKRWVGLMKKPTAQAEKAMADMEPALQSVRSENAESFESFRQRFAEQGEIMTDNVAGARNELRRDIRKAVNDMGFDFDTSARAPLVDHLTRAAPVPSSVSEVMGASDKLEAAKSQHEMAQEQRRHLGAENANRAGLGM